MHQMDVDELHERYLDKRVKAPGLFFFGEDSAFKVTNCSVRGSITGAVTPGAVAGRAVNSTIESCSADVTLDGEALAAEVGETTVPYESDEQGEEAEDAA